MLTLVERSSWSLPENVSPSRVSQTSEVESQTNILRYFFAHRHFAKEYTDATVPYYNWLPLRRYGVAVISIMCREILGTLVTWDNVIRYEQTRVWFQGCWV